MPRKTETMKLSNNNAYSAIINRQDYRRKYCVVVIPLSVGAAAAIWASPGLCTDGNNAITGRPIDTATPI